MKLAKAIAALVLGATIMNAVAISANATNAVTAGAVKTNVFSNRYVLSGTVIDHHVFGGISKTWCTIVDENGEEWVYAYDENEIDAGVMPPVGMRVCMIMDNNGTAQDITDDSIEDLLWCDCDCDD